MKWDAYNFAYAEKLDRGDAGNLLYDDPLFRENDSPMMPAVRMRAHLPMLDDEDEASVLFVDASHWSHPWEIACSGGPHPFEPFVAPGAQRIRV